MEGVYTDNYRYARNGRVPGWNGSVRWNGKAEGNARPQSPTWSEDVITDIFV